MSAPDGAQPERTALAWIRTGLSLCLGVAVALRLLLEPLGTWALVPTVLAVPTSAYVLSAARHRYAHGRRAMHPGTHPPDGRLPALVAAITALLGVIEVAYVWR